MTNKSFLAYLAEKPASTTGVSMVPGLNAASTGVVAVGLTSIDLANEGCVLDGATNDLVKAQAALNALSVAGGGRATTAGKSLKISGRLIIPENVTLDTFPGSVIPTGINDGIDYTSNSASLTIFDATGLTGWAGPAHKISDDEYYDRLDSYFCGPQFGSRVMGPGNGTAANGTALLIHGAGGNGITDLNIPFIDVYNCDRAVHIWAESSWNNFHVIGVHAYGCKRFITLEGAEEKNGHQIYHRIQPNTGTAIAQWAIKDEGANNSFEGRIWDWNSSGSTEAVNRRRPVSVHPCRHSADHRA
jgi:hypothetical protein